MPEIARSVGQFHFRDLRSHFIMKRPLLYLSVVIAALSACQKPEAIVETDAETGFKTEFLRDPKTKSIEGELIKKDDAGNIIEKANYSNGKLNGFRELFYPDGKLKVRERYKNDTIVDLYEYFHPNGNIELAGYYIQGEMYGVWKKYFPEGNVQEEVLMVANEENGPFTEYQPSGSKEAEGYYLNGPNENGKLQLYDSTGVLVQIMWCNLGRCETTWKKG